MSTIQNTHDNDDSNNDGDNDNIYDNNDNNDNCNDYNNKMIIMMFYNTRLINFLREWMLPDPYPHSEQATELIKAATQCVPQSTLQRP